MNKNNETIMEPDQFLKLGTRFLAYVSSEEEGNGYTALCAKTTEGKISLRCWKENRPRTGDYLLLEINDTEEAEKEYHRWKSISLDSKYGKNVNCDHKIVDESEIPDDVRKKINRDRKPQLASAMEALNDPSPWKDKGLHGLILKFVEENGKKFLTCPAATSKHHNWRGGLLVHTAEVAANCIAIASNPMNQHYEINTDALLLASWLHDSGKTEVYRMEGEKPEIDGERERLIGHTTLSNLIFRRIAGVYALHVIKGRELDPKFLDLVSHCILSHHERPEWGAVVEPKTIEAHILCRADFISSRMPD